MGVTLSLRGPGAGSDIGSPSGARWQLPAWSSRDKTHDAVLDSEDQRLQAGLNPQFT
jgi:hypothetical protein